MLSVNSLEAAHQAEQRLGMKEIESPEHLHQDEGVFVGTNSDRIPTHLVQGSVVVGSEIVRWTLEVPEELIYDGVAQFIPGYGGIKQTSRPFRNAMAQEGVATLTYTPARGSHVLWLDSARRPQDLHAKTQLAIASDLRTDKVTRQLPSEIDPDKKHLILHSMGGLAGTLYTDMERTAVDRATHIATVGFGSPSLLDFLKLSPVKMYKAAKHELLPAVINGNIELSPRNLRDIIHYYTTMRALFEARSCLRDDVRETVAKQRDKGVRVDYLNLRHDIVVPNPKDIHNHVDRTTVMENAGHLGPQCKPRQVAAKIIELQQAA